ncbi:hypothetical protein PRIPAC_88001 [Pristionchus pacificus]|uniref:Uncharacterized protein n=1 Tax=Pristionchus pacificus TaxID=54126 RepID=A0A454XLT2_PRIPA|nr:hypothetical protein PRIPAC_88001 [Pristionchus pacificus]|eukprot:PDM71153.1 hypothetical protein PRIPAC_43536 [Pristionchus pacificus]
MERLYLFLLLSAPLFLCQGNKFSIPLLFGNLSFGKNPDGTTNVNVDQNVNILGNGAKRNTTFTVGNGTFLVKDDANAIVNNSDFGGGGTFGVAKDGVVLDNKINAGNKTIEGGLGKESNFLSSLFGAFSGLRGRQ